MELFCRDCKTFFQTDGMLQVTEWVGNPEHPGEIATQIRALRPDLPVVESDDDSIIRL